MSSKRADSRLSNKLKSARTTARYTREQLAEKLETTATYIYLLETGRRRNPSLQLLRKWAAACHLTLGEML